MGTLDSLMQLSDDLVRIDMLVENMVRKVEKQYIEVAGDSPEALKVNVIFIFLNSISRTDTSRKKLPTR